MKTIILLLTFITSAASAQYEYLRIYQRTYSAVQRSELKFDFGVKYDSADNYERAVAPKNLVAALEYSEDKGWEYITTFVESYESHNLINVLMRRRIDE